jgi:3-phenylpropionate/cinnamic acid dioxygenase small subunit
VAAVLATYARACDERRWDLFDEVFTEDAVTEAGGVVAHGRAARVASIRRHLGGCGFTQHLLGNQVVHVEGDEATSSVRVRAFHVGAGERSHLTYEVLATYDDRLRRTPQGWRIHHRVMTVGHELGTREVLQPEAHEAGGP